MGREKKKLFGIVWVYLWLSWKMVARSLRTLFVFYVLDTWHHKFKASKSHYGKKIMENGNFFSTGLNRRSGFEPCSVYCNTAPGTEGQGSFLSRLFPPSSISYCIVSQLSMDAHSEGVLLLFSIVNLESGTPKSCVFFSSWGLALILHLLTNKHDLSVVPSHGMS